MVKKSENFFVVKMCHLNPIIVAGPFSKERAFTVAKEFGRSSYGVYSSEKVKELRQICLKNLEAKELID